jgi:hypothetical protein
MARNQYAFLVGIAAALVTWFVLGALPPASVAIGQVSGVIGREAVFSEVKLTDSLGRLRILLDASRGEPSLTMYDDAGEARVHLLVANDVGLYLSGPEGRQLAGIDIHEGFTRLALYEPEADAPASALMTAGAGAVSVALHGSKGRGMLACQVDDAGLPAVGLYDGKGEAVFLAP